MYQTSSTDSTLPTHTVQLSDDVEEFYCGCGLLFEDQDMFKNHSLQKHKGRYFLHSSHYVNHVSLKVMKCQHWDPSVFSVVSFTVVKAEHQAKIADLGKKESQTFKGQPNISNLPKPKKAIQFPTEKKLYQIFNFVDPNETKLCDTQQQFDQFHFQVKEEPQTKRQQILRGRSCFQHERQDQVTCLSDMEQSTPTLCRSPKIQKISELPLKKEAIVKQQVFQGSKDKLLPSIQNSANPETVKIFARHCNVEVPMYMLGVFQFLRWAHIQASKTQSITFNCGCGELVKNAAKTGVAFIHIAKSHKRIVPSNSSHIFLSRKRSDDNKLYRLLSVDGSEESHGWGCPCRPEVEMTQKYLIKHVIHVHKGISPFYVLPCFQRNKSKTQELI